MWFHTLFILVCTAERPLYPGAPISCNKSWKTVYEFSVSNRLTDAATQDLLQLIVPYLTTAFNLFTSWRNTPQWREKFLINIIAASAWKKCCLPRECVLNKIAETKNQVCATSHCYHLVTIWKIYLQVRTCGHNNILHSYTLHAQYSYNNYVLLLIR